MQQQKLQAFPPGNVAMVQKGGQTYYVFPDAANNRALVGGPKQYQAYQQLRLQQKLADENLEAAEDLPGCFACADRRCWESETLAPAGCPCLARRAFALTHQPRVLSSSISVKLVMQNLVHLANPREVQAALSCA